MTKVKNISFHWTSPALVAGRKTVTRRDWKPQHAARYHAGELVEAYGRQPRFGGKPIATIRLTQDPYIENPRNIRSGEWQAEGFEYLAAVGAKVDGLTPSQLWAAWRLYPRDMWVIRFELVEVL